MGLTLKLGDDQNRMAPCANMRWCATPVNEITE